MWDSVNEYCCVFSYMLREIRCKKIMKSVDDSGVGGISVMGVSQSPNSGISLGKYEYWDM